MRFILVAVALCLSACGGSGSGADIVDSFVLGEPLYKTPNVKQSTRAYKEAFKLAQSYRHEPGPNTKMPDLNNRREVMKHAEELISRPTMGTQDASHQKRYYKGIKTVNVQDCAWSRISDGGKTNYLYGLHGLDVERGWLCRTTIVLKFCPKCDRDTVEAVMLFVQRDNKWLFAGGRDYDDKYGIGCSWANFIGTSSMPNNGPRCIEKPNETWPPVAS